MKALEQITIKSNLTNDYCTTVTLGKLGAVSYCVITLTIHKGVESEFIEKCDTYKEALHLFLDNVAEYASHTALMNLQ